MTATLTAFSLRNSSRALGLLKLPPRVALLRLRCVATAARLDDRWSLSSTMPAPVLAAMLDALRGTRTVVELGTGTAWGTLALAVADSDRRVLTYDPTVRPNRDNYLALVGDQVRDRIEFREEQASAGPPRGLSVDGLVIDSSHTYDDTVSEFRAWEPAVREGGVVVFDDYLGEVANAVSALGLTGKHVRRLFVWVKNQSSSQ